MKSNKHQRIRFLFKLRHVQFEAWMINTILFACQSKNHLSLDSRMILSQPRENGVNAQAQAQILVQAAQALVRGLFLCDVFGDFYEGLFDSRVGHVHEVYKSLLHLFKGPKQRRSKEARVGEVSSHLEKICTKLETEDNELALRC